MLISKLSSLLLLPTATSYCYFLLLLLFTILLSFLLKYEILLRGAAIERAAGHPTGLENDFFSLASGANRRLS